MLLGGFLCSLHIFDFSLFLSAVAVQPDNTQTGSSGLYWKACTVRGIRHSPVMLFNFFSSSLSLSKETHLLTANLTPDPPAFSVVLALLLSFLFQHSSLINSKKNIFLFLPSNSRQVTPCLTH